ncbi:MAG: hypothetical protein IJF37_07160 [Lachnospiraceae bacterium]|nr:hypothetical protein [Lachnospiraceae bacterium]
MENFVQDTILILILTIVGSFYTEVPFAFIALSGVLLCVTGGRRLKEKCDLADTVIWLILAIAFSIASQNFLGYLVMWQGKILKREPLSIFFPSIIYMTVALLESREPFYRIILNVVILLVIAMLLYMVSRLIREYVTAKDKVAKAVSVTAVNEMYAKKLNQELIIKNYLADKNARLEERENISRNIHNIVGHSITAAIMTLDAADMLYDTAPDRAREKMNAANERIRTSLDSIRQAVRVLDGDNKYVSIEDFVSELTAVTDSFVMDTMIKVHTNFGNVGENVVIPHEHTEFLTGALQEFLSNGVRHGGADIFTVTLTADSRNLRLKVVDNGESDFSHNNQTERIEQGYGLKKIDSYVKRCGGSTTYNNDGGFSSEVTIKLLEEDVNG